MSRIEEVELTNMCMICDGKGNVPVQNIVFLYIADKFTGELKASNEGEIFWYPLSGLAKANNLIDGFGEMLPVFTDNNISEIFYERTADDFKTIYC